MKLIKSLLVASAMSGLLVTTSIAGDAGLIAKGDKIFNSKKIGNCLACHAFTGKNIKDPGSFGPDLSTVSSYPEEILYDMIYDIYKAKGLQISAMPAFGTNGWLDDSEIKAVVAYLKSK